MVSSCEVKDVWYFLNLRVVTGVEVCTTHSEADKAKHLSLEQKGLLQGPGRDGFLGA